MKRALLILGLMAGLALGAYMVAEGSEQRKTTARLTLVVSTQAGLRPVTVHATALLVDPDRQLNCPAWVWVYGDGSPASTRQSDCEPYEQRPERYTERKDHTYTQQGDFQFCVVMVDGGEPNRIQLHDCKLIMVRG